VGNSDTLARPHRSVPPLDAMRIRRLLVIAGAGIALVVIVVLACSAYWEHKQTPFQDAPKLIRALQAFSRDQVANGRRLPPEISLQDLLREGYLTTSEVRAFEGVEVTFNTQADESHPQTVLASARMPDGQYICLLADGSVQGFSSKRHEQMRTNLGQSGSPAEGSQPIRGEANAASGAAGAHR
jgi:hypothetical protein